MSLFRRLNLTKNKKRVITRPKSWHSVLILSIVFTTFIGIIILRYFLGDFDQYSQLDELASKTDQNKKANKKNYLLINNIEQIGELDAQVQPIKFESAILEERSQDETFKDQDYIRKHKHHWTIQVMDVSQAQIIQDYLSAREDKNDFSYFRYLDQKNSKRYVLIYKTFNKEVKAVIALNSNSFNLPSIVKPLINPMKSYMELVDQYHLDRRVTQFNQIRYRKVTLHKTAPPVRYIPRPKLKTTVFSDTRKVVSNQKIPVETNAFTQKPKRTGRIVHSKKTVVEKVPTSNPLPNTKSDKASNASETKIIVPATSTDSINDLIRENQ